MNDLISRQAAIDAMSRMGNTDAYEAITECIRVIEQSPTIDPVKHGKWEYVGVRGRFPCCKCSICGNVENADWAILSDNVNYCPNCGARMDGD